MADAALAARSPLEGLALPCRAAICLVGGAAGGAIHSARAPRRCASPAGWFSAPSRLRSSARRAKGRSARLCGSARTNGCLIADGADAAAIGDVLESVLEGTAHSLVDVSHRQIGLIASGPAAARVLNAGCPLDLDLKAFPVGFATRTLFDKAEIVLWRRAEATFHVEVWRSFAPYLAASLAEAARGAPEW